MVDWSLPCMGLLASFIGCGLLLPLLRRLAVIDQPGARRLHAHAVVRGGGLMIVLLMLMALLLQPLPGFSAEWLLLALIMVAVTGLADDVHGLSAWLKLPLLAAAAGLLVLAAGSEHAWLSAQLPAELPAWLPNWMAQQSWLLSGLLVVAVLWFINLFNFMDGSNGLTATQTILSCAGLLLFADPLALSGAGLATLSWLLLTITLGFLPWNFPRARMFLGDVGSLSLGLLLAALLLAALKVHAISLPMALLLPAVFIVDATATLCLRLFKGRKWYQAHTDHAYQQLVLRGWSHAQVWWLYLLANVLLWPLLWLQQQQWLLCLLGYLVLLCGWTLVQYQCGAFRLPSSSAAVASSGGQTDHRV